MHIIRMLSVRLTTRYHTHTLSNHTIRRTNKNAFRFRCSFLFSLLQCEFAVFFCFCLFSFWFEFFSLFILFYFKGWFWSRVRVPMMVCNANMHILPMHANSYSTDPFNTNILSAASHICVPAFFQPFYYSIFTPFFSCFASHAKFSQNHIVN